MKIKQKIFYMRKLLFTFARNYIMQSNKINLYAAFILMLISILSCKKSEPTGQVDTESQTAIDYSICEREFAQMGPTSTNLVIKTKSSPPRLANGYSDIISICDTLTYLSGDTSWTSPTHQDPVYEYDFGACGSYAFDGIPRTGKWQITFRKGGIKKPGTSLLIRLLNYKLSTVTYSADSVVFKNGGENNGIYTYTISVYNALCTASTWTISYSSTRSVMVDTKNTTDPTDDNTTIVSGSASGKNRENRNFTVTINSLTKPANCKYITKGTVQISPSGLNTRTIDYGNGTCDNKASVSVNGSTFEITLN